MELCRLERIKEYYNDSLLYDRPMWSKGVISWYNNRELHDFKYEPWDFGLEGDGSMYSMYLGLRQNQVVPRFVEQTPRASKSIDREVCPSYRR